MKEIVINSTCEKEIVVAEEMLAKNVGSGNVSVYATPMMVALMENVSAACLEQFLDESETSVGTRIDTTHISSTPLGMKVKAIATIVGVNSKEIRFEIKAYDECGPIGEAVHTRVVLNKERFENKANAKFDLK